MSATIVNFLVIREHVAAAKRCAEAAKSEDGKTAATLLTMSATLTQRARQMSAGGTGLVFLPTPPAADDLF